MSRMIRNRWKSKFARFVRSYGVELLAAGLDVRPSAIYHWIRGATAPRPAHAAIIQRLASERGVRLTLDQIYQHCREVNCDSRTAPAAKILQFPAEPNRRAVIAQCLRNERSISPPLRSSSASTEGNHG
jgi:hypothetical protein